MPPKRTIFADPAAILRNIHTAVAAWEADVQAKLAVTHWTVTFALERELERAKEGWIKYDLATLSGCDDLSASAKQVWRRTVRELEAAGLVEIEGLRAVAIRLTPEGRATAEQLTAADVPDEPQPPAMAGGIFGHVGPRHSGPQPKDNEQ